VRFATGIDYYDVGCNNGLSVLYVAPSPIGSVPEFVAWFGPEREFANPSST
jgi:hypothetical protein